MNMNRIVLFSIVALMRMNTFIDLLLYKVGFSNYSPINVPYYGRVWLLIFWNSRPSINYRAQVIRFVTAN